MVNEFLILIPFSWSSWFNLKPRDVLGWIFLFNSVVSRSEEILLVESSVVKITCEFPL